MNTVQEKVMNSDIIIPKIVLLSPAVLVYVIQFAYKSIFIPEIISQSKEKEKKKNQPDKKKQTCDFHLWH